MFVPFSLISLASFFIVDLSIATWGLDLPQVQLFELAAQEGLSNMPTMCAYVFVRPCLMSVTD